MFASCFKSLLSSLTSNLLIILDLLGSQEVAKEIDSWTRAAGDEKVSKLGFDLRRTNDLLRVYVCELFLIISPIISDLESIYYCRFGSQELAKGMDSGTRAAGDEKVSQ